MGVSAFSCGGSDSIPPDGASVEQLWFTPTRNVVGWDGMPAVAGNTVIFGAYQGLAAFDSETGAPLWTAKLWSTDMSAWARNIAVGDGHACMADQLSFGCVDVGNGRVLWTKTDSTGSSLGNGESAYSSGIWYFGGRDHKVHAVDPETGDDRWATDIMPGAGTHARIFGISVRGDTVYATTNRWLTPNSLPSVGNLVALDRATGMILWNYTTPGDSGGFFGRALLTDRLAVINDEGDHALVAIDLVTGKEAWRTVNDQSGFVDAMRTPVLIGDTVFAASADTQVYAIDARTGVLLWRVRGDGNALGFLDACPRFLVPLEFAGGRPFLVDRRTHSVSAFGALPPSVTIYSRFSIVGNRAYAVGTGGVYAFKCN